MNRSRLREWMDMPLGANVLPWLQGKELERLQRMLEYFLLNNQIHQQRSKSYPLAAARRAPDRAGPGALAIASKPLFLSVGAVAGASDGALVLRRSLVTGQELPKERRAHVEAKPISR